jgi:dipeptidase E
MKFYLSSYKLGNETAKLKDLVPANNRKIGYIANALDFSGANPEKRKLHIEKDMKSLQDLQFEVELLDLKDYFGRKDDLRKKIDSLGGVFISGGNAFVLRQAMKISGFDEILKEISARDDFVYAGYSAAGCVLSPDLKAYQIVDDATDTPYKEQKEVIWEGLGFIDYAFLPHWDSDHPESADIDKEIAFCEKNKIKHRKIRDGEVIIID